MPDVMIARESAVIAVGGARVLVRRRRTTAHSDAQIVREHPYLWQLLPIDFPTGPDSSGSPSAKEVRAWAREQDIEVPSRGKIPDDVVAAYRAAQET